MVTFTAAAYNPVRRRHLMAAASTRTETGAGYEVFLRAIALKMRERLQTLIEFDGPNDTENLLWMNVGLVIAVFQQPVLGL